MKKTNRLAKALLLPLCGFCLTSCLDFSFHFDSFYSGSDSSSYSYSEESYPPLSISMAEEGEGFFRPASVNSTISFHDIGKLNEDPTVPTTGKVKFLVLPIEFSSYAFTDSRLSDIKTAFEGSSEDTNYWESLKSYYYKSSYGQLEMDFVFADPYVVSTSPSAWFRANRRKEVGDGSPTTYGDNPEALAGLAMREAVASYKEKTGDDCTQFDADDDGYIDACMMIYSCHNGTEFGGPSDEQYGDLFWAYQYSDLSYPSGNLSSPVGNRYFWASYDFFYEGVKEGRGVDAHTLIHETGHLLGADDYYNYGDDEDAAPAGGMMMMDHNILDHDVFTKLSYGWVRPYVVTDSCSITITPFEDSGECVLLADSWNGSSFDEYVLFQLYTPTGLNELDSTTPYGSYARGYRYPGVVAYHIDARLCKGTGYASGGAFDGKEFLSDGEVGNFEDASNKLRDAGLYVMPATTNSQAYDATLVKGKGYELIQLIQSGGKNTLKRGGNASDGDLFHKDNTFSLGRHYDFFPETNKLNNGESLPYEVYFEQVNSEYATLQITKKA